LLLRHGRIYGRAPIPVASGRLFPRRARNSIAEQSRNRLRL